MPQDLIVEKPVERLGLTLNWGGTFTPIPVGPTASVLKPGQGCLGLDPCC